MMRAAVITVSDSCFLGQRVDVSGPVVADLLLVHGFHVVSRLVVPDEQGEIEDALRQQCEVANLVVTTGGTGSIAHAMLAYREHANQERGVTRPNVIKPETAHPAPTPSATASGCLSPR